MPRPYAPGRHRGASPDVGDVARAVSYAALAGRFRAAPGDAMIADEAYWVHLAVRAVEIVGTVIIVAGAFGALATFLVQVVRATAPRSELIASFRSGLGRSILLGLEFLVAADIINTIAVEPTIQSLLVLAGIVLIRTFLSFSLEVEIDGRWPWQKDRSRG